MTPKSRTGRLNGNTEASRVSAISSIWSTSETAPDTVWLRVAWLKSEYLILTVTVFPVDVVRLAVAPDFLG